MVVRVPHGVYIVKILTHVPRGIGKKRPKRSKSDQKLLKKVPVLVDQMVPNSRKMFTRVHLHNKIFIIFNFEHFEFLAFAGAGYPSNPKSAKIESVPN